METIRRIGNPVHVVPLTNQYNRNFMPMDANGEVPVPTRWFDASDVYYQVQRPEVAAREIDTAPVPVKPRVLNPMDFMKGGGGNV
jgi:hypothetical protein